MDPIAVTPFIDWVVDALSDSANVSWFQALVAGTIGAWAGSWATQRTINRHEDLKQAQAELRAVNHAINLCFTVTNHYLGYKKQMTQPMLQRYQHLDQSVQQQLAAGGGQVLVEADFLILPTAELPVPHLERILLEQVSMSGRGLVSAMQLRGVSQSLNDSLAERRQLIGAIQGAAMSPRKLAEFYLALPDAQGNVDSRFRDNVGAIATQTDDCIFFSTLIAKDLHSHGKRLLRKHGWRLGSVRRNLTTWNWNEDAEGLMPKDTEYLAWLKGFPDPVPWWKFWVGKSTESH